MKEVERKVIIAMENADYMEFTPTDVYIICKNIINAHGENPSDEEIKEEVEIYYNN